MLVILQRKYHTQNCRWFAAVLKGKQKPCLKKGHPTFCLIMWPVLQYVVLKHCGMLEEPMVTRHNRNGREMV